MPTEIFSLPNVQPSNDYKLTIKPRGLYRKNRRVKWESCKPRTKAVPQLKLAVRNMEKSVWTKDVQTKSIGQFILENVLIGAIQITIMSGMVLSTNGFRFSNQPKSSLELAVDIGTYKVSGLFVDKFNDPIPGPHIIFSWENIQGKQRSTSYRHTSTNFDGVFTLTELGSGEHELIVSDGNGLATRRNIGILHESTDLSVVLDKNHLSYRSL